MKKLIYLGLMLCLLTACGSDDGLDDEAKENAKSSGLEEAPIRWLVDDCVKFVEREIRRGNRYDGIVMDPPSYGRGSGGQIWKVEDDLFALIKETIKLLSDSPLFFIVNSYTTGLSSVVTGIPTANRKVYLPCGTTARWEV